MTSRGEAKARVLAEKLRADPEYQEKSRRIAAAFEDLRRDGRKHSDQEIDEALRRHGVVL